MNYRVQIDFTCFSLDDIGFAGIRVQDGQLVPYLQVTREHAAVIIGFSMCELPYKPASEKRVLTRIGAIILILVIALSPLSVHAETFQERNIRLVAEIDARNHYQWDHADEIRRQKEADTDREVKSLNAWYRNGGKSKDYFGLRKKVIE